MHLPLFYCMKRGQATLFLIVGILAVLVAGLFIMALTPAKNMESLDIAQTRLQLSTKIQACLQEETEKGLFLYGLNENKIESHILARVSACANPRYLETVGYSVGEDALIPHVTITNDAIVSSMTYPVRIKRNLQTASVSEFTYVIARTASRQLPAVIFASNKKAVLEIPAEAIAAKDGIKIDSIDVVISHNNNPELLSPLVYDFLPSGTEFSSDARLYIEYDDEGLSEEEERAIQIVWFSEKGKIWIGLDTEVDVQKNIASAYVNHFSRFALSLSCGGNARSVFFDTGFVYVSDCEPCNALVTGKNNELYDPILTADDYRSFPVKDNKNKASFFSQMTKLEKRGATSSYNNGKGCFLSDWDNNPGTKPSYGYAALADAGGEGSFTFNLKELSCVENFGIYKSLIDDGVELLEVNGKDVLKGGTLYGITSGIGYDHLNEGGSITAALVKVNKEIKKNLRAGDNTIRVKVKNIAGGCSNARFFYEVTGSGVKCEGENCCKSLDCAFPIPANFRALAAGSVTTRKFNYLECGIENKFGAHLMLQDYSESDITRQLDKVKELTGPCGWAKGFDPDVNEGTAEKWAGFVAESRRRKLIPVLRLGHGRAPVIADAERYADYVARVNQLASMKYPGAKVEMVEIWNEPNLDFEWNNNPSPSEYARFLHAAAVAIKVKNPDVKIMNGGLAPTDGGGKSISNEAFIDGMFEAVPALVDDIDIWASHPYLVDKSCISSPNQNSKFCFGGYNAELSVMKKYYGAKTLPPVLITETSWHTLGSSQDMSPQQFSEATRFYWISDSKVIGVTPFQFTTRNPEWKDFQFVDPSSLQPNSYFDSWKNLRKSLIPDSSQ